MKLVDNTTKKKKKNKNEKKYYHICLKCQIGSIQYETDIIKQCIKCNEFPERFEANQYYKNGFIGSIINNFFRHY